MTTARWQQIEELFAEALELPASARDAFLDERCAVDDELRCEVRSLLANVGGAETLRLAVANVVEALADARQRVGVRLGPYRLVELLGEGGMGAVYLARRDDDEIMYDVAIKILRYELASPSAIARFRDERQILATLEHPAIVRLLDGGSTSDGMPYLVMERVTGEPITTYARTLPVRERAALIVRVAAGLAYAHGKLVVHRDIKPSNIIVGVDGAPKLLDFGISKLLNASTREAPATRTGMGMLTPEYASPEQARGKPVSVATDVYSLGAVLYEMLAGRPPQTIGASVLETLEAICKREPPRPSTLAVPGERAEIAGDLDSIVLKALHKEPASRYASIDALIEDLERFLDGRPVRARDATRRYRLGKFVTRNRGKLALATVFASGLTTATVVSLHQTRRANEQAARAEAQSQQLLVERGWQEVQAGHAGRALPYLVAALRRAGHDADEPSLRFLIAEALRPFEAEVAVVPFPGGLNHIAWMPDGSRFVLAGLGGLTLYDADGRTLATLTDQTVSAFAIARDGTRIAAAIEGHARVWDHAGRVVADMLVAMPTKVSLLADGRLVVAEDQRVIVQSGASIVLANERVTALATSHDGRTLATGTDRGTIHLFDATTGIQISEFSGHTEAVVALQIAPDGRIFSGSHDRTARIWSAVGEPRATIVGHDDIVETIALDRGYRRVATCSRDGTVKVWDATTGRFLVQVRGHDNGARSADFSSDGHHLLTTGGDNAYRVWDLATGTLEAQYEARVGGGSRPNAMAGTLEAFYQPSSDLFLAAAGSGAKLIRASRAPLMVEMDTGEDRQPRAAVFSPDEQRIAIVGIHQVEIWDATGARRIAALAAPADELLWDVAWSRDATHLVIAGRDVAAIVPIAGGPRVPLVGHRGAVKRIAYAPDGTRLLTAGSDGTVRLWDPRTAHEIGVLAHPTRVSTASWSRDGSRIITACTDGVLRVWDVASRTVIRWIPTGEHYLDVAWSPDETALAAAAHSGTIAVWELDGTRRFVVSGHSGPVTQIAWSPDGALLATSADDQTARIWDAHSGRVLATRWHRNGAMSAAWSRDGTRLLIASTDGAARIWDVHRELRSIPDLEALLARYLQFPRIDDNRELGE